MRESVFTCEGQIKLAERFEGGGPAGWRRLQRGCDILLIGRQLSRAPEGFSGDGDRTPPGG